MFWTQITEQSRFMLSPFWHNCEIKILSRNAQEWNRFCKIINQGYLLRTKFQLWLEKSLRGNIINRRNSVIWILNKFCGILFFLYIYFYLFSKDEHFSGQKSLSWKFYDVVNLCLVKTRSLIVTLTSCCF